jgi:hypothetical protein
MSDYDVGYGKPPKHSQFKKGVCPNPHGRGKRRDLKVAEILNKVLNAKTEFRERGKLKKASRIELSVRRLAASALKGDVGSAAAYYRHQGRLGGHDDRSETGGWVITGASSHHWSGRGRQSTALAEPRAPGGRRSLMIRSAENRQ